MCVVFIFAMTAVTNPTGFEALRAQVKDLVERSGTSFYWAMRLLPEGRRDGMFAVYAFCRDVDDIADEPAPTDEKRRRLAAWREEIDRLYAEAPTTDIGRALLPHVESCGLHRRDFLAVIDGMETDAQPSLRLADMAALHRYCDQVACAVGRLSNRVFGLDDPQGDPLAAHLGLALQLTNILRDLKADARLDRLYLPRDLLDRHGIAAADLDRILADRNLGAACGELASLAEEAFGRAEEALAVCDPEVVRPAVVMKEVYRPILHRLVKRGWRRLDEKVRLSKAEKMWIGLRHGLL